MSTTLLVLVGFFLLAGFFVYLAIASAKKAEAELNTKLNSIGFTRCLDIAFKDLVARQLQIVNTRHVGNRLLLNLYHKDPSQNDHDLYFCDYRFASASGKARGSSALLVCLISKTLKLPRFTIESYPEGGPVILTKLFEALSDGLAFPDVKQIDSQLFGLNKYFRVYVAPEQRDQLLSIKSEVGAAIADKSGISLDAKGNALVLSDIHFKSDLVGRKSLDLQKVNSLVNICLTLNENLKVGNK